MNSYWQVLRTYLWRPRFWVLGFFYLLLVWGLFFDARMDQEFQRRVQAIFSAIFASLAGCFLALHVRRQFTTAAAQLVPDFAAPHLVIAALASALLWFIVPSVAILAGHWPPGALALHACAAILMAIVVCWPRALVVLVAIPVLLIWENRPLPHGQRPFLELLIGGELPALAGALVALAFLAQIVAGLMLLRLPRQGVTTNDEFTLDVTTSSQDVNPLNRWFLAGRDAAAERLLEARVFRTIQRWRIPVATSFAQLSIPAICVLAAAGIGLATGEWQGWSAIATAITCAVLMFVPLGPWHVRRHSMSQEILLPVTRPRFFRQIILSLAFDMALWMTEASAIIAAVALAFRLTDESEFVLLHDLAIVGFCLCLLWSMAFFVFGVGLATMRWPLWLPIVAGIALFWFFGAWTSLVSVRIRHPQLRYEPFAELAIFVVMNVLVGLFLAVTTYRRWVRSDVA